MNFKQLSWIISFLISFAFFYMTTSHLYKENESYVADESQLATQDSVTAFLKNNSEPKPIYIPTGIFIQSMHSLTANSVHVSGYIWQKYDRSLEGKVVKGFVFPEGLEMQKYTYEAYRRSDEKTEIIGWYFEGRIFQNIDYSKYPLDHKTVRLRVWHKEFDKNVILVPDLSSYSSTLPKSTFGLDDDIVLIGYNLLETYFNYKISNYDTNFGLVNYSGQKNFPELQYNMVLKRSITDSVVSYFLPLMLVIILCFCTLLSITFDEKKRGIFNFSYMNILKEGAALFFVILLAHISLREEFSGAGLIYLEYFYLISYGLIIYTVLNAFFVVHAELAPYRFYRFFRYGDNHLPKVLFLPIFSLLSYVVTMSLI